MTPNVTCDHRDRCRGWGMERDTETMQSARMRYVKYIAACRCTHATLCCVSDKPYPLHRDWTSRCCCCYTDRFTVYARNSIRSKRRLDRSLTARRRCKESRPTMACAQGQLTRFAPVRYQTISSSRYSTAIYQRSLDTIPSQYILRSNCRSA